MSKKLYALENLQRAIQERPRLHAWYRTDTRGHGPRNFHLHDIIKRVSYEIATEAAEHQNTSIRGRARLITQHRFLDWPMEDLFSAVADLCKQIAEEEEWEVKWKGTAGTAAGGKGGDPLKNPRKVAIGA